MIEQLVVTKRLPVADVLQATAGNSNLYFCWMMMYKVVQRREVQKRDADE
jgi:hypothetical protein